MKKDFHRHEEFYKFTGNKKADLFEYRCSECGKDIWLEHADEAPFKYEKKETREKKETICWDV